MGRQKQYTNPAARQAAYRLRIKETTMWVDRDPFLRMDNAVETLHQQMHRAAVREHALAQQLVRGTSLDTLEVVVSWLTSELLPAEFHSEERKKRNSRLNKE